MRLQGAKFQHASQVEGWPVSVSAGYGILQTNGPEQRGDRRSGPFLRDFDWFEAGKLWNAGRDTKDIASHFGMTEGKVYRFLETIKKYAKVERLAPAQPLHEGFQHLAHGLQTSLSPSLRQCLPLEATLAAGQVPPLVSPPFPQFDDLTHAAISSINSVSQMEIDTGETGNVPKTIGQAHD